jgi:uncharacterized protein YcsI (UPF0317 family)
MRLYEEGDVEKVGDVTRPFVLTHGEPIACGWDAVEELGIRNFRDRGWGGFGG